MQEQQVPVQFGDGCAVSDDILYLTAFPDELDDEISFTRMFTLNTASPEQWFHIDHDGHRMVSVCLRAAQAAQPRAVCALSEEGVVEIANSQQQSFEQIDGAGLAQGSRGLGPMHRIREIAHTLYACGAGNQVYKREPQGWTAIDGTLAAAAQQGMTQTIERLQAIDGEATEDQLLDLINGIGEVGGLDDIGGTGPDDLYVCGVDGTLAHWDGQGWTSLRVPTDAHLHSIHAVSAQTVWVCGHNGTLLKGNRQTGFTSILDHRVSTHLWSVREFDQRVYVGTTKGLWLLNGEQLEAVDLPDTYELPLVNALDSTATALWVVADRFVARLAAGVWQRFDHPDNQGLET